MAASFVSFNNGDIVVGNKRSKNWFEDGIPADSKTLTTISAAITAGVT
jgi:hypothetical protein